jgi:hypothetical protein
MRSSIPAGDVSMLCLQQRFGQSSSFARVGAQIVEHIPLS